MVLRKGLAILDEGRTRSKRSVCLQGQVCRASRLSGQPPTKFNFNRVCIKRNHWRSRPIRTESQSMPEPHHNLLKLFTHLPLRSVEKAPLGSHEYCCVSTMARPSSTFVTALGDALRMLERLDRQFATTSPDTTFDPAPLRDNLQHVTGGHSYLIPTHALEGALEDGMVVYVLLA